MFLALYFQEDNYETDVEVDGCPLKVELIDTAGNVSKQKKKERKAYLPQWSIESRKMTVPPLRLPSDIADIYN